MWLGKACRKEGERNGQKRAYPHYGMERGPGIRLWQRERLVFAHLSCGDLDSDSNSGEGVGVGKGRYASRDLYTTTSTGCNVQGGRCLDLYARETSECEREHG